MKHLKRYNEKEMSAEWLDSNQDNYLLTNKHKPLKKKKNRNSFDIDIFKEISWKDITVKKESLENRDRYSCFYINKEYFLADRLLTVMDVCNCEGSGWFNRIHIYQPLSIDYRDIGLGYKCYKAVIDKAKWVRSSEFATNENSRRIWKNLIKDPDYYSFEVYSNYDFEKGNGFIVFCKTMSKKEIKAILDDFVKDGNKILTNDPKY